MSKKNKSKSNLSAVEIAAKQRHLHLLGKVKDNQALSAKELEELGEYEAGSSTKGKRGRDARETGFDPAIHIRLIKDAARELGVCVKTIRRYVQRGKLHKTSQGYFYRSELDLLKAGEVDGMVVHRQRDTIAQAGIREAKQKMIELELAEKQGAFHNTDECEQKQLRKQVIVLREITVMRKKILAQLPTQYRARANKIIKDAERNMRMAVLKGD